VIGYSLPPCFLKKMKIPDKVYHLMYVTTLSCTYKKRMKKQRKKEKETKVRYKERKEKTIK
jgi:hypothetical protein